MNRGCRLGALVCSLVCSLLFAASTTLFARQLSITGTVDDGTGVVPDVTVTLVMPAYTVVDAGIRRSLSSKVALDFRLTNLTDAFYAYNFSSNGLGGGNWNVGQPRSFEVSLTAGF